MTNLEKDTNPLLCDLESGMCEMPNQEKTEVSPKVGKSTDDAIKIIYFTDPICSSCWGIEPQLRKLKLEYGQYIDMEYKMGGLLPDWNYNSGGISKPSDVAHHWDEVSSHYDMPIDGDVWLEDPLHSSYPPSIAYKAAQLQDVNKANLFLRELREMVFLKKNNIAKWEHLTEAAKNVGLDIGQLKIDFEGTANQLFEDDLNMAREFGVRGFPTLLFMLDGALKETIYGTKPYAFYEMALLKINPAIIKSEYKKDFETLFGIFPSLTAREFTELSGTPRIESELQLNDFAKQGKLEKKTTKNGHLWTLKSTK